MVVELSRLVGDPSETVKWTMSNPFLSEGFLVNQTREMLKNFMDSGSRFVSISKSGNYTVFEPLPQDEIFRVWYGEWEDNGDHFFASGFSFLDNGISPIKTLKQCSSCGNLFIVPSDTGISLVSKEGKTIFDIDRDFLFEQDIPEILKNNKIELLGDYTIRLMTVYDILQVVFERHTSFTVTEQDTLAVLPLSFQVPKPVLEFHKDRK
ncbi:TPA: hypothetical protein SFZ51_001107 [Campylobacter jejuni]|nr:hypothetical protein [Campylobacter jejuni]HEG8105772.1 hypothetical protein [Campylobacter jejuni]HEG8133958.1 hypothetical protein [Campylobacter jejuni]